MKSTDEVMTFYQNANISTNPAADNTVLADACQAGGLTQQERPALNKRSIGRILLESPITKLAVAGLIIAATIIGVSHFNGTVVEAVEFSEITKAMAEVPWLHVTQSGFAGSVNGTDELWFGIESKINAHKYADGDITFENVRDHKVYEYLQSKNKIVINEESLDTIVPLRWLESTQKALEREGAKIVARMGDYQGRRVQIQEVSLSNAGDQGGRHVVILYFDPRTKLLYAGETKDIDSAGKVTAAATMTVDYPQTGPLSIYDLGAPRDASIVDQTPSATFRPVWREYLRHKAELPNEYIAVIVHQEKHPSDVVQTLDVNYKSGQNVRLERYILWDRGEVIKPPYQDQLDSDIGPLLAWARHRYDDPNLSLGIQLDDGKHHVTTFRNMRHGWSKLDEIGSRAPTALRRAWPIIASTFEVIEDDYARQNGLICIERLTQGRVSPEGKVVSNPGRFLHYLDPAHDYLCRRQVSELRPDADWQQDKNWLKNVDPSELRGGSMLVCEIPEIFQAPNGRWYPRVIIEKEKHVDVGEDWKNVPLKVTDVRTIYLDVSPTFPEGVFDRDRLPGQ